MIEWPLDKLAVINSALAQTGDNLINVENDGSDEWTACSPAFERGLAYALENHGWGANTKVSLLTATTPAPADTQYDTAYDFPPDILHLIWVRLDDRPVNYDILAGQLVLNAQGGPPPPDDSTITPGVVTIKYISTDNSDMQHATPTLVLALQTFVMSGIYRGPHKNAAQADKMWLAGEEMLQRARTRHDQQKPKRAMFNSRITAARRIRRPWPPTPGGWGGSGIPG